jgi:hypothetical protein
MLRPISTRSFRADLIDKHVNSRVGEGTRTLFTPRSQSNACDNTYYLNACTSFHTTPAVFLKSWYGLIRLSAEHR